MIVVQASINSDREVAEACKTPNHHYIAHLEAENDVLVEALYGHPDNVELYPGILAEEAKEPLKPGSGLCAGFTISFAILSDAVALVRGDRFYTVDYSPASLTNFGCATKLPNQKGLAICLSLIMPLD